MDQCTAVSTNASPVTQEAETDVNNACKGVVIPSRAEMGSRSKSVPASMTAAYPAATICRFENFMPLLSCIAIPPLKTMDKTVRLCLSGP